MTDKFRVGLKTRVFNYNLWDALKRTGKTRKEIAEDTGISAQSFTSYLAFKHYPHPQRQWAIAEYLAVPLDAIFPEHIRDIRFLRQPAAVAFTREEAITAGLLPSQDQETEEFDAIERADLAALVTTTLEALNERERRVIQERFGLNGEQSKTLEQVAKIFGVTRERIRQIEQKAFRKLRQPELSQPLYQAIDGTLPESEEPEPEPERYNGGFELPTIYCWCSHAQSDHTKPGTGCTVLLCQCQFFTPQRKTHESWKSPEIPDDHMRTQPWPADKPKPKRPIQPKTLSPPASEYWPPLHSFGRRALPPKRPESSPISPAYE